MLTEKLQTTIIEGDKMAINNCAIDVAELTAKNRIKSHEAAWEILKTSSLLHEILKDNAQGGGEYSFSREFIEDIRPLHKLLESAAAMELIRIGKSTFDKLEEIKKEIEQ